jgi:hypothetical protein
MKCTSSIYSNDVLKLQATSNLYFYKYITFKSDTDTSKQLFNIED